MKYEPLVSVIIPVYNGANYVGHAIECALSQTYQNIEIIIVNDGSTDHGETERVVKKYQSDRIRYYEKENGGVSSALNYAINEMHGEWFSWLSHDDGYYPQKIQRQIETINDLVEKEGLPPEQYVIYGQNETIDSRGNVILRKRHKINNDSTMIDLLLDNIHDYKICGCAVLVHRSQLLAIGGFNESIRTVSDAECFYRLILHGMRFYYLNEILVQSRQHKKQVGKQKAQLFQDEGDRFHVWLFRQICLHEEWKRPGYLIRFYAGVKKRGYTKAAEDAKRTIRESFSATYVIKMYAVGFLYEGYGMARRTVRWFYRRIRVK